MSSSSLAAPPERVSGNGVSKPDTESGAESGAEFGAAQAESAAAAAAGVRKQPRLQRLISLPCGTCSWGSLITARPLPFRSALRTNLTPVTESESESVCGNRFRFGFRIQNLIENSPTALPRVCIQHDACMSDMIFLLATPGSTAVT